MNAIIIEELHDEISNLRLRITNIIVEHNQEMNGAVAKIKKLENELKEKSNDDDTQTLLNRLSVHAEYEKVISHLSKMNAIYLTALEKIHDEKMNEAVFPLGGKDEQ